MVRTTGDDLASHRCIMDNHNYNTAKGLQENGKAIAGLNKSAATQLASLISKVDLLVKSRTNDALERKVEELSGQLVSLARRSRQQQELLDKILEKVSTPPPTLFALATPRSRASHPLLPQRCPGRKRCLICRPRRTPLPPAWALSRPQHPRHHRCPPR